MSADTAAIRGQPRARCPVCGVPGPVRFADLPDVWHGVPGLWDVRVCEPCETLWLDPEPLAEDIPRLYPPAYPTHDATFDVLDGGPGVVGGWRREIKLQVLASAFGYGALAQTGTAGRLGRLLARVSAVRWHVGLNNARLLSAPAGRLLDVGCGNGSFLRTIARLGWDVSGIEPDPLAAAQARRLGFDVRVSPIESCDLEPASYDAITLHHVIEHLSDPAAALIRLTGALRKGGVLVSISPDPMCLTARWFGRRWRALDAPRHLVLPGPRGLRRMAERSGLTVRMGASTRLTRWFARDSLAAGRRGRWLGPAGTVIGAFLRVATPGRGDEVVLVARRA